MSKTKLTKSCRAERRRSKETGRDVIAGKTKYMVLSRDQNAGRSHGINFDNISFERV